MFELAVSELMGGSTGSGDSGDSAAPGQGVHSSSAPISSADQTEQETAETFVMKIVLVLPAVLYIYGTRTVVLD